MSTSNLRIHHRMKKVPEKPEAYVPSAPEIVREAVQRVAPDLAGLKNTLWHDDFIKEYHGEGQVVISDTVAIRLGRIMLFMVGSGPITDLSDIVSVLAMALKDPETKKNLFPANFITSATKDSPLTKVYCNKKISEYEHKLGLVNKDGGLVPEDKIKEKHPLGKLTGEEEDEEMAERVSDPDSDQEDIDTPDAAVAMLDRQTLGMRGKKGHIVDLINEVEEWEDDEQAAFYSFLAAVLCRICAKSQEALSAQWSKCLITFRKFYCKPDMNCGLPELTRMALGSLDIGLAANGSRIRAVLSCFLTKYAEPKLSQPVHGVLQFTLLLHTSYNGMQLIPLTVMASQCEAQGDLTKVLQELDVDSTRIGMITIMDFFDLYSKESAYHPGIMAPWSRLLDNSFWSTLSAKKNSFLAALLMALCEEMNPTIFQMVSLPAELVQVSRARTIIRAYKADAAKDAFIRGAAPGSILARYGNVPDDVETSMDQDPYEGL